MYFLTTILLCGGLIICSGSASADSRSLPATCSYEMQIWNVNDKKSVSAKKVVHPYAELKPEEVDPATGCTVCSEDQEPITLPSTQSFSACYKLAP